MIVIYVLDFKNSYKEIKVNEGWELVLFFVDMWVHVLWSFCWFRHILFHVEDLIQIFIGIIIY
jgi:hypothetical protein